MNYIIIGLSALVVISFFLPWVKGTGSIVKPVEDSTKAIQDLKLTKETAKTTRGVVDTLTETLAAISLKRTLAGYQIPTSKNKGIKRIGIVRYLLYSLPLVAIL
ncbi:MAG: hypothetical protein JSV93_06320 [Candidatus Omnitrophota bacterium]|nr:MAG: hypothetical protein JSV93_06320 [Candidatus Omnitrophota bacterium]